RHSSAVVFYLTGFEGRAAQSNSPVDCCDRERPSDRSRASQILSPQPENSSRHSSAVVFYLTESLEIIAISRLFSFCKTHSAQPISEKILNADIF
ncbi:MAG: hypothetical protein IKB88_04830, partial [Clostridia bacterium]|nr:hypothetical protein [Clostridia bacterium]